MKKGYKFRIYPSEIQKAMLTSYFGSGRFVYNQLLSKNQNNLNEYKENTSLVKPKISRSLLFKELVILKEEFPFLKEASSVALQQKILDLLSSYESFFKKRGKYPTFKSKRKRQTLRLVGEGFSIGEEGLKIAKFDKIIKIKWSRTLPSSPTSVTISQEPDGRYYASFICEYLSDPTYGDRVVGLDMGIKSFFTDSDGNAVCAPKYFRKSEHKLAKLQKSLSRKKKGSNNRSKARVKVAKLHAKTKHQRNDFLHKLSRRLVNESKIISIETLNVQGMLRNRHLAKSIQDLGWSTFVHQLIYKSYESHWCTIVQIDRWYPSTQTCSCCGHRLTGSNKLTLGQRFWTCPACNVVHDRDTNAGVNIRNEGHRIYNDVYKTKGDAVHGAMLLGQTDVIA